MLEGSEAETATVCAGGCLFLCCDVCEEFCWMAARPAAAMAPAAAPCSVSESEKSRVELEEFGVLEV